MIQKYINAFQENKSKLGKELMQELGDYLSYQTLLKLTIETAINPELDEHSKLDTDNITHIDNGHYQGTEIYVVAEDTYQPSTNEHIFTHNFYGSCSGCDVLLSALHGTDQKEKKEKLLKICLHLVERMNTLGD